MRSPDSLLPSPLTRLHVRRRRPAVLLGGVVLVVLLFSALPTVLSVVRLAAMRVAALSIGTHASAPLPVVVPGLLAASWRFPDTDPATFLKLHIFSEDTPEGRRRRDVIRAHSPAAWVAPGSVELRFVVPGSSASGLLEISAGHEELRALNSTNDDRIAGTDARRSRNRGGGDEERREVLERSAVDAEAAEFSDILRVPGDDVAAEWISAVGKAEPARWIVKCDDSVSTVTTALGCTVSAGDPAVVAATLPDQPWPSVAAAVTSSEAFPCARHS